MSIEQTYYFYLAILVFSALVMYVAYRLRSHVSLKVGNICKITSLYKNVFIFLSLLIIVIPLVNRECGTDTSWYWRKYAEGTMVGDDLLFFGITSALRIFIKDPKVAYGLISFATVLIAYIAFTTIKDTVNVPLCFTGFLFTLYFYQYNYIRMMMAASIIFLAYAYLIKGNKKKAFICMAFAIGIHISSAIVFIVYAMIEIFGRNRQLCVLLIFIGVSVFLYSPYFFLSFITYERYRGMIDFTTISETHIGIGKMVLILPIVFLEIYYFKRFCREKIYNLVVISTAVNLAFSLLGYFVAVASRLSNMYFVIQSIFFVPWLYKKFTSKKDQYFVFLVYAIYLGINYYFLSGNFKNIGILPYR